MDRPSTVHLGTQYYRAPFPNQKYWADDLKRMRDAGLDTVQLWVLWGWAEATPGEFRWDDYDRLVELAGEVGLNVVLSTIAEIQPYWIHREVPGCELVNHRGEKVYSVNRGETHFGCTPGGCTDNPEVWERMSRFLQEVAQRYAPVKHLVGWDVWNELRWNVEAEGRTCYCDHTVAKYHRWLEERFGSLDALNRAWQRRYGAWDEVWPGKRPDLPYTDMMPWMHFLTERANAHARDRYAIVKTADPDRPVTVHGGAPTPGYVGWGDLTPLDRGNDWSFAEGLDGVGCSSFPLWQGLDDADFGVRVEFVKSAAGKKRVWLSEVQGGRASSGLQVHKPVPARDQQRWIWNGYACGADTILFWCWRDEVFGRESAGFGIIGRDGLADERVKALAVTGEALREHGPLLAAYHPDEAQVGVLFSPQSYYYYYAQQGDGHIPGRALQGTCRALVRHAIPYRVVEDAHLTDEALAGLTVLFLPRATALSNAAQDALSKWVKAGGTVVTESECGAFDEHGLYAYPEDRWVTALTGVEEIGRRALEATEVALDLGGRQINMPITQWTTPLAEEGQLLSDEKAESGRVIQLGSYPASGYMDAEGDPAGYEAFVKWCLRSSGVEQQLRVVSPDVDGDCFVHLRTGMADDRRLLFVFAPRGAAEVVLEADAALFSGRDLTSLRDPLSVTPVMDGDACRLTIPVPEIGFVALAEADA